MRSLLLFLTLPLFILDQATKQWTVTRFKAPTDFDHESITVIPGWVDLVRIHNTGVAFGMANGSSWANAVFGGITIAALLLIWWLCRNNAFPTKVSRVAVALLLSGIFGNLLDRFMRGYVVDFLHFHYQNEWSWPSFNVADSCICVAAGLLFISAFQKTPAGKPAEQKA